MIGDLLNRPTWLLDELKAAGLRRLLAERDAAAEAIARLSARVREQQRTLSRVAEAARLGVEATASGNVDALVARIEALPREGAEQERRRLAGLIDTLAGPDRFRGRSAEYCRGGVDLAFAVRRAINSDEEGRTQ